MNPVPTSLLADDLATASLWPVYANIENHNHALHQARTNGGGDRWTSWHRPMIVKGPLSPSRGFKKGPLSKE